MSVQTNAHPATSERSEGYTLPRVTETFELLKVRYLSDVHLEFGPLDIPGDKDAVLVLAGDITTVRKTQEKFFQDCVDNFKSVIYIFGNHEYYGGDWNTAKELIQMTLPEEVCLLDNSSEVIDGVMFIGSTLWTDMNNYDPITILQCKQSMNDYHLVSNEGNKLQPETTIEAHEAAKAYISGKLEFTRHDRVVVVTHHMPSPQCVHQRYVESDLMNGAYRSDLEDIIYKYKPNVWISGHSHHSHELLIDNTRLLANPRGYDFVDENPEFDVNKTFYV